MPIPTRCAARPFEDRQGGFQLGGVVGAGDEIVGQPQRADEPRIARDEAMSLLTRGW
jgi:hypothetical protein